MSERKTGELSFIEINGGIEYTNRIRTEILALRNLVVKQEIRIRELEGKAVKDGQISQEMPMGEVDGKKIVFNQISSTIFKIDQDKKETVKQMSPIQGQILATFLRYKETYIPWNAIYHLATGEESCLCTKENIHVHICDIRKLLRDIAPQLARKIQTLPGGYIWSEEEKVGITPVG